MGKPSKSRLPVKSKSEQTMSKSSLQMTGMKNNPVNSKKLKNKKRKKHRKTKDQIKNLFEKLRNASNISLDASDDSSNHSVNQVNSTVIVLDDTIKKCPKKRRLSETSITEQADSQKVNNQSVEITDDVVLQTNHGPCNSGKKSKIDLAITGSALIAKDIELRKISDSNSIMSKNKLAEMKPIVVNDGDVQINPEPCSSKTPRKKGIAPPINCSTPIIKSNLGSASNNNADGTKNLNVDLNQTKVINRDSFLTIDLTTESDLSRLQCNTVIDLDNTQESQDCTLVSISNASSMSGDSQVTVLQKKSSRTKRIDKFVSGIAKLDASEKGRLLELITQNIFNGCKVPEKLNSNTSNAVGRTNQATETVEDTYIKEVILGQKQSRNSIGSNIYNPEKDTRNKTGLRMVVIDGSNVAMECKFGKSSEPRLLDDLERQGYVVYTPSREIQGKMIASYDDRYIVQCAAEFDGVIVSGDNYRDLHRENPRWRSVIENRLLPFTWVEDMIMFPRDPLGRNGPTLEQFLRHPEPKSIASIVL